MTARAATLLLRPSARMVPFAPLVVATALSLAAVLTAGAGSGANIARLRGAALLLGVSVVFALDDPAADITGAAPLPRWLRGVIRAVAQLAPAAIIWLGLLLLTVEPVPASWLTAEAAGLVLLGWAVAASWREATGDTRAGAVAAPVLIVLTLAAYRLPPRWALFAAVPDDPLWHAARGRWLIIVAVALSLLTAALVEPARRARWR